LAANTTAKYLLVLLDLHRFRRRLSDGLREHPFEGMDLDELLGSLAATGEIPHIPSEIAVPFLLVAVRWVREYGPEIAAALEHCDAAYAVAAAHVRDAKGCGLAAMRSLRRFRFQHAPHVDGQQLPQYLRDQMQLRRLVRFGVTAGFVVIAGLTGMRLSELLSLEEDCLEVLPLDDGSGECLLYVRGTLVKTSATALGETTRWVAGIDGPENQIRAAVELVSRLTAGLRARSGDDTSSLAARCTTAGGGPTPLAGAPSAGV